MASPGTRWGAKVRGNMAPWPSFRLSSGALLYVHFMVIRLLN